MSNRKIKRDAKRARPKTVRCMGCDNYHRQRIKKRGKLWAFCSHTCRRGFEVREALKRADRAKPVKVSSANHRVKIKINPKLLEDNISGPGQVSIERQVARRMNDQIAKDLEAEILGPHLTWPARWDR